MQKEMFFLVRDRDTAHKWVETLKAAGFGDDQVSFVLMERSDSNEINHAPGSPVYQSRSSSGTTIGGIAGAGIGAVAGWTTAIGIAGGSLIAGGPILALLAGAAAGGTTGGLVGALVGAGIPQSHVENSTLSLERGNVIVVAHPRNRNQIKTVEALSAAYGIKPLDAGALNITGPD